MSGVNRFGSLITNFLRPIITPLIGTEPLVVPNPGGLFNIAVRYNIRNHFPRPCERKRIKRHGWNKRMSTPGGQRVLMRRILKEKHVYSH